MFIAADPASLPPSTIAGAIVAVGTAVAAIAGAFRLRSKNNGTDNGALRDRLVSVETKEDGTATRLARVETKQDLAAERIAALDAKVDELLLLWRPPAQRPKRDPRG